MRCGLGFGHWGYYSSTAHYYYVGAPGRGGGGSTGDGGRPDRHVSKPERYKSDDEFGTNATPAPEAGTRVLKSRSLEADLAYHDPEVNEDQCGLATLAAAHT